MRRLAALASLSVLLTQGWAGDNEGRYAVKGVGLMSCQTFADGLENQSSEARDALMWLAGYLTAINASSGETFDIVSWQSEGMIAQALSAACGNQPDQPLAQAVAAMVETMRPDRVSSEDILVEIRVGEQSRMLYQSVLRRIQDALSETDEAVEPTGTFDDVTEASLRSFQARAGLAVTGFPDSMTVYNLLHVQH